MEVVAIIVDIIIIVFGVLSLILFFKLWRMCNDVKEIAASMKQVANNTQGIAPKPTAPVSNAKQSKFTAGQLVIVKEDESQFRIDDVMENADGSILYYSEKFNRYYPEDEIEDFKVYWDSKK